MGIQQHGQREVLDYQFTHGLAAQVRPGDDFAALHAVCHQGTGPADSRQVDGPIFNDRLFDGLAALAFANHTGQPQVQQARGVGVHAAAGGGASGTNSTAWALRRRADVVNGSTLNRERQLLALVQQLHHAGMGGIAGGIHHAGKQHGVSCFQRCKV